jgi:tetratricopeptide (TPR) repeat protein
LTEPWLLIIVNAHNPDHDLKNLFPRSDRGHIVVNTRNPDARIHGTAGSIELKGLEEEEALHLLLEHAQIPRPWDATTLYFGRAVSKALGYLPLALVQAGRAVFTKVCDLKDYLKFHDLYWNKRRVRSPSAVDMDGKSETQREDMIYSAFDFSLEYLQRKNTVISQDAVQILNIMAFYHFENIRVDIFTRAIENRRNSMAMSAAKSTKDRLINAAVARLHPPCMLPQFLKGDSESLNPYRVREALHELYALSLINYDGKNASFSLHPLVHSWARDRLSRGERAVWAQIAFNTLTESILLPPDDAGEFHAEYRKDLLPHLDKSLAACPLRIGNFDNKFGRVQLALAKLVQQTLLFIVRDQAIGAGKCGYIYAERGRFTEGALYLSMVKDILVQTLGYENERTMVAMLGLAGVCWGLGRLEEAIALQKRVVEARSNVLGLEHHDTLVAMDQLGRSFWLHGEYHEALQLQRVTTARMKASLGSDHPDTLAALDNLGVTLGSWHRFHESMEMHKQVLFIREKKLGRTDLETLTTLNNLAMALLGLGELSEAKKAMEEVVEQRQMKLGKEHPWTLWAICNLAKVMVEIGQLGEAEKILIDGIVAGRRSLSDDHLGVLMGRGQLARVYAQQGRAREAEILTLEVVDQVAKSRGEEHPDYVYAMFKLAQLYEQQTKIQNAINACNVALQRANKRLTARHPLYKKIESYIHVLQDLLLSEQDPNTAKNEAGIHTSPRLKSPQHTKT